MTKRFENLGKHRWLNSKAEPVASKPEPIKPIEVQPVNQAMLRSMEDLDQARYRAIHPGAPELQGLAELSQYGRSLQAQQAGTLGQVGAFGMLGSLAGMFGK